MLQPKRFNPLIFSFYKIFFWAQLFHNLTTDAITNSENSFILFCLPQCSSKCKFFKVHSDRNVKYWKFFCTKCFRHIFIKLKIFQVEKREKNSFAYTQKMWSKWNHVNEIKNSFSSFPCSFFCLQSKKCYWIFIPNLYVFLCEKRKEEIEKCNQANVISFFSSLVFEGFRLVFCGMCCCCREEKVNQV